MRTLIAGIALLLAACVSSPAVDPADTVRLVTVNEQVACSVVVIEPDYALTARHCLSDGMTVDGLSVEHISTVMTQGKDIAVLYVPGLQCPCASLGKRPVAGDKFLTIGFPAMDEGKQRVTEGVVDRVSTLASRAPWAGVLGYALGEFVFSTEKVLDGGMSGGGLFVRQDGEWRLVAINVIGVLSEDRLKEIASGFTPVDVAANFLP